MQSMRLLPSIVQEIRGDGSYSSASSVPFVRRTYGPRLTAPATESGYSA